MKRYGSDQMKNKLCPEVSLIGQRGWMMFKRCNPELEIKDDMKWPRLCSRAGHTSTPLPLPICTIRNKHPDQIRALRLVGSASSY